MSFRLATSLCLVLASSLAGCGGSSIPKTRWVFEYAPLAGASIDRSELPKLVRARIPKRYLSETTVDRRGDGQLVIEGPIEIEYPMSQVGALLAKELAADARELEVAPLPERASTVLPATPESAASVFDASGGVVRVDDEWMQYAKRDGVRLLELERGAFGSRARAHAARAQVQLVLHSPIAFAFEPGAGFALLVSADCLGAGLKVDVPAATKARDAWFATHPSASWEDYARVSESEGGAPPPTRWYPYVSRRSDPGASYVELLGRVEPTFDSRDIETVEPSFDELGLPALRIELREQSKKAFTDWTRRIRGCQMAVVVQGRLLLFATVNDVLPGSFVISGGAGGFSRDEVDDLRQSLTARPLPVSMRFVRYEAAESR